LSDLVYGSANSAGLAAPQDHQLHGRPDRSSEIEVFLDRTPTIAGFAAFLPFCPFDDFFCGPPRDTFAKISSSEVP